MTSSGSARSCRRLGRLPRALRSLGPIFESASGYGMSVEQFAHIHILGHSRRFPRCGLQRWAWEPTPRRAAGLPPACPSRTPAASLGRTKRPDWGDTTSARAVFFSRAELAAQTDKNWRRLVHANELACCAVRLPISPGAAEHHPRSWTSHNLAYQCLFREFAASGSARRTIPSHTTASNFYYKFVLSQGGIVYASISSTVARPTPREDTTPELACGLEGLLRIRSDSKQLTWSLNGIDESWRPAVLRPVGAQFGAAIGKASMQIRIICAGTSALAVARTDFFWSGSPRLVHQKASTSSCRPRRDHRIRRPDHREPASAHPGSN